MSTVISIWLQPPAKLKGEIFKMIKDFSNKYKVYSDLKSYKGPHITILEIHSGKYDLKTVMNKVKKISIKFKAFNLRIDGIGYFRRLDELGKRNFVIYLKVKNNRKLVKLKSLVDIEFPNESVRHSGRKFIPHITITHRELDRKRFYDALKEYKDMDFIRSFKVDKIVVSKYNKISKRATIKYIHL
jgi:2'-5' RNA ligase